jgi:spore coat protein CotF
MPFGAHETMETHEILMEKINCITHFNLYAQQAQNPQLRDMIARHQQEEIASYNELVAYTHDYNEFRPLSPNTDIRGINPQQIQYGLNNPPPLGPESNARFDDREIGIAMLLHHKNGARNCTWASLECADPNLRRMMLNCASTCVNQAYEVFLFMNEQGVYQVPTLKDHTAKEFLHSYQPADQALENRYGGQGAFSGAGQAGRAGQFAGVGQTGGASQFAGAGQFGGAGQFSGAGQFAGAGQFGGAGQYAGVGQPRGSAGVFDGNPMNNAGSGLQVGSRDSVLYGSGGNAAQQQ